MFSQWRVSFYPQRGRVSLVPGPFLVRGPMSFLGGRVSLAPCPFLGIGYPGVSGKVGGRVLGGEGFGLVVYLGVRYLVGRVSRG